MKRFLFVLLVLSFSTMAVISKPQSKPEKQMHTVDFNGDNFMFVDLRTGEPPVGLYAPGDTVLLKFQFYATDTNYNFYLDGVEINESYFNEKYGYCFHFIMPDRDVQFTWTSYNSMIKDIKEE